MNYLIISAVLPQILCQFVADLNMKPDVTFGDHNDRFDLTSLVQQQNRFYDKHAYADGDDDYRRQNRRGGKIILSNGLVEDFGYKNDQNGKTGSVAEYEENLKKLLDTNNRRAQRLVKRLHEDVQTWRRSNSHPEISDPEKQSVTLLPPDPEKEILMHHAVPVHMTIQGYLQVPLVV